MGERRRCASGHVDQLCEMGVVGLLAPEAAGGFGCRDRSGRPARRRPVAAALPEPIVEHAAVAIPLLRDHHAHADEWLSRAASGGALIGVGLARSPYVAYADQAEALLMARGDDVYLVPRAEVTLTAQRRSISAQIVLGAWNTGDGVRIARGDDGRKRKTTRSTVALSERPRNLWAWPSRWSTSLLSTSGNASSSAKSSAASKR